MEVDRLGSGPSAARPVCTQLTGVIVRMAAGLALLTVVVAAVADHLPPVEPILPNSNHDHEDHSGHDHSSEDWTGVSFNYASFNDANLAGTNLNSTDLYLASFIGADLRGVDLRAADLSRANFNSAKLQSAKLDGMPPEFLDNADFTNADLSHASLTGTGFFRTDMSHVNFSGADLRGADLFWSDFSGANFTGADLRGAVFDSSDIGAYFTQADLTGAVFRERSFADSSYAAQVSDVQLRSAASVVGVSFARSYDGDGYSLYGDLSGLDFRDAKFIGASIMADFDNANLSNADFTHAMLWFGGFENTSLAGANISGANFTNAYINHVDLRNDDPAQAITDDQLRSALWTFGVNVSGNNMSGFNLSGIDFYNADLSATNLSYADLSFASLQVANLRGADLSHANLQNALLNIVRQPNPPFDPGEFKYADLTDADLSFADLRQNDRSVAITDDQLRSAASVIGVNLAGNDLSRFNLNGLNLRGADLSLANLTETDFSNASLDGVDLRNPNPVQSITDDQLRSAASVTGVTLADNDLSRFNLNGLDLRGADLSLANLTETDFSNADLRGATIATAELTSADFSGANLSDAVLGDPARDDGFVYDGVFDLTGGTTTLQSQGLARLDIGSTTTLDNAMLVATNGLLVKRDAIISGVGQIDTPDDSEKPLHNNGRIVGDSPDAPITLEGYVSGFGSLKNVVINGELYPSAFSLKILENVEINGTLVIPSQPTQYTGRVVLNPTATLELIQVPVAGVSHQLFSDTSTVVLGGTLSVHLIHTLTPTLGQVFTILTAGELMGEFDGYRGDLFAIDSHLALAPLVDAVNHQVTVTATFPGDVNLDFQVDATDLNLLALNWHQQVTGWDHADFNNDGFVNAADLNLLALNWLLGTTAGPSTSFEEAWSATLASASVPEPGAISLLVLGGMAMIRGRGNW